MNEIVENLYLSDRITSEMNYHKFSLVINLAYPNNKVEYGNVNIISEDNTIIINIGIYDSTRENISTYFPFTNGMIDTFLKKHKNVLVHCEAGISRSTSVIIAYLMYRYNIPPKKALALVRSRRNIVNPNNGFMDQLIRYYLIK